MLHGSITGKLEAEHPEEDIKQNTGEGTETDLKKKKKPMSANAIMKPIALHFLYTNLNINFKMRWKGCEAVRPHTGSWILSMDTIHICVNVTTKFINMS